MANSGSGNKFLPVNYNRSYGHSNSNANNNQQYGASRNRAGGGNSMVVLSRPRSSQKSSIPKLSVPPPLNLPSLRKEHQRFDSSGSHGSGSGGLGGGIGSRPGSSGVGWSKPAVLLAATKQENEANSDGDSVLEASVSRTAYVPPSARMNAATGSGSGNVSVLKREDFPSLKASLPASNANLERKQKENTESKQKKETVVAVPQIVHSRSSELGKGKENPNLKGGLGVSERERKREDIFNGLPSLRVNPRSDWEDDERDTGHSLINKGRDNGFQKGEPYWEREYDYPRHGIFNQKPLHSDSGKMGSVEYNNARPSTRNDDFYRATNTSRFGYKQPWNNKADSLGGSEWNSRHRGDSYQSNSSSKSQMYSPGKMLSPYGDKSFSAKNGKHFVEDSLKDSWADSAGNDMFPVALHGLVKRKKDPPKESEFYDPVRESFEAELERVQKMQEMERKRTIEEQERAIEMANREEEERRRIVREQEEYRKKAEEEAREAAWRAERERTEALQKAEEQRIAREEEKRKFLLEEERRKEGARQKLLELEERIARRQKEAATANDGNSSVSLPKEELNEGDTNFMPRWDSSLGGFNNWPSRSLGKWSNLRDGDPQNGPLDLDFVENLELEDDFAASKPRYSIRQPRVLPPPSFAAIHRSKDPGTSRVEEAPEEKLDSGSTRCDSQSSFSVSSPPDTPAHQSHDEFDTDFRGSLSDKENFVVEKNDLGLSETEKMDLIVAAEEEDWGSERNEELQEQEEYDEDESYDGEDEAHDGDDRHSKLAHEFDCMNLEPDAEPDADNLVLCFNEGVEVRMPNDDSENGAAMKDNSLELQKEDKAIPSRVGVKPEACDSSRNVMKGANSGEEDRSQLKNVTSAVEFPGNLQFGLFSSPPLIPSPVPAIQIGSIKMPLHLHLHQPIGPITSHASIFHFGELRYTSPIYKGMLPLRSQPAPQGTLSEATNDSSSKKADDSLKPQSSNTVNAEDKPKPRAATSAAASKRRNFDFQRGRFSSSHVRGRRYVVSSKQSTSLLPTPDASQLEPLVYNRRPRRQRGEYRVRETSEKIQSSDYNDKPSVAKNPARQFANRRNWKPSPVQEPIGPPKNAQLNSEERVDSSLEDRVVRVFEQPGIEAPSDDDDFIKVRSKRQLLNERRAQREKEIKAKNRLSKVPKKLHPTPRSSILSLTSKNALSSSNVGTESSAVVVTRNSPPKEASLKYSPLPPIGSNAKARAQHSAKNVESETRFEKGLSETETGLVSWDSSGVKQEVMALTQTQLEEAMRHETRAGGDEPVTKGKPFSSASPVSSLLAGERIQFGAVTSPTILPATSSAAHPVGLPPRRTVSGDICSIFFEKERVPNHTSEAEAEAAASAIAVAAITSDDSAPLPESTKKTHIPTEEPLSVALPADLSVETPMWPPLSNASSSMLPHVAGHFPFYDMNPRLGGRMFAFGQPEDSSASQTQPQKVNPNWQHHANMDPVYGQPAGFPGHFIGPPANLPPVPPQMVVYNNFAPVGLSFMGAAAYVPSGKQPDWKHIPTSLIVGEGDFRVIPGQHNPPTIHPHVPPRPMLPPITSPVTMFDASSLQPPPDRWPVITATHLQPLPENPLPMNHGPSGPVPGPVPGSGSLGHDKNRNFVLASDDVAMQSSAGESSKDAMKPIKAPMSHQKYAFTQRNEWGHRRSGYHNKYSDSGMFQSKTKQIYVAKQTSAGSSAGS